MNQPNQVWIKNRSTSCAIGGRPLYQPRPLEVAERIIAQIDEVPRLSGINVERRKAILVPAAFEMTGHAFINSRLEPA